MILRLLAALWSISVSPASASAVPLVKDSFFAQAHFYGDGFDHQIASLPTFLSKNVIRASIQRKPSQPYDAVVSIPTEGSVKRGDVLLGRFYARCTSDATCSGKIEYSFGESGPPYKSSIDFPVNLTNQWRWYDVPFVAEEDYGSGQSRVRFWLGFQEQTVEITDVETLNYGTTALVQTLPRINVTYEGRNPDAPWRKDALDRIAALRQGDLAITVRNRNGEPISGASVHVQMIRHAFAFGGAVSSEPMLDPSATGEKYRQEIKQLFNVVTIENDLKWPRWEQDRSRALRQVKWCQENGIAVRGHNLLWGGWKHLPDLKDVTDRPEALRNRINQHILDEAGALRGRVVSWDVVNEPVTNRLLIDRLGPQSIAEWLKVTHRVDPSAKLFINDEGIDPDSLVADHQDNLFEVIKAALSQGAPLDGIGLEGHFDWNLTPIEKAKEILDRFAQLHKKIEISEFDVNVADEKLQADYLRDFMTLAFSHPAVDGFILWSFADNSSSYQPMAALFRPDWTAKPAGKVWQDFVFKKWWTDASGTSDSAGKLVVRGFLGDYLITASSGGKVAKEPISLGRDGKHIVITLK